MKKRKSLSELFAAVSGAASAPRQLTQAVNNLMFEMALPPPGQLSQWAWYSLMFGAARAPKCNSGFLVSLGTTLVEISKEKGTEQKADPEQEAIGCMLVGLGMYRVGDTDAANDEFTIAARQPKTKSCMRKVARILKENEPKLADAILNAFLI